MASIAHSGDFQSDPAGEAAGEQYQGYGTPRMRNYALFMLTLISALSLVDRVALGIMQEPIKKEFQLTDFQLGILGGPAFAILYSMLGLPIAQLAERYSRISIVSVSLAAWSVATAACGMAGNYAMLVMGRLGVSVGEAGCNPASQAALVDYFPFSRRATALAIYSLSVPCAAVIAGFAGGWLADAIGWRWTFAALGMPGIVIALILQFTVPEPVRAHRPPAAKSALIPQLRVLSRNATLWFLMLGASASCFVGYGLSQYLVSFLMRVHHLSIVQAAAFNGVMFGVFAAIGTFACGALCDRLAPRFPRVSTWLPALGMLAAVPLYVIGYWVDSFRVAAPLLFIGAMLNYFYMGSIFAVVCSIVPPHLRTLANALTLVFMNLIGYGMGPPIMGYFSDLFHERALAEAGLTTGQCLAAAQGPIAAACAQASAHGLQLSIVIGVMGYFLAGILFLASVKTVRRDWIG
ncbi:major facilitator superfamily MFS_1 [Sphingobium chlorophenolicum L-1]|uniref:Major facilitator superfamily MFS_1 n=1 Tax=Sphingobium chlorophenolicum L-1 TaxID=690566 RepID=F6F1F7_SPHCR|nr:MFS transporter [Sphingobium chlorophenolicum]AEG51071.1 major facilitator superfamily MFS_1 [Sphingobium chlorophenolicum L-1]AEG51373.1 major facilitator superfamily MFS_1 [Sphingobium chlorophenolicum L-1]